MKKVKFIVLVNVFMMASGSLHAAQAGGGAGEVQVDQKKAGQLGLRLIEIIKTSKPGDNIDFQVQQLLQDRPDVDAQNNNGTTALIEASSKGHANIVEILLAQGAKVAAQDTEGNTALMLAAYDGHVNIVEMLLTRGADVNAQDELGRTALMWAAYDGHANIVKMLLDAGADVDAQNKKGRTALMWAVYYGHANIVQMLLVNRAGVNIQDTEGITALMLAAENGHVNIVEMLLTRGADVNAQDELGRTALMEAAENGRANIVEILLTRGADVNVQDSNGNTALMLTIIQLKRTHDINLSKKYINIIQILVQHQILVQDQTDLLYNIQLIIQDMQNADTLSDMQSIIDMLIEQLVMSDSGDNHVHTLGYLIFILEIQNLDNSTFIKDLLTAFITKNEILSKDYASRLDEIKGFNAEDRRAFIKKLQELQNELKPLGIGLK